MRALAGRQPFRRIAAVFGVSERSLRRHRAAGHVLRAIRRELRRQERAHALDIMARLQEIDRVVGDVLDHARKIGDVRLGLSANAEARANALAYLRLRGDISEEPSEDWTVEFERAP